jgi:hypothetical protein
MTDQATPQSVPLEVLVWLEGGSRTETPFWLKDATTSLLFEASTISATPREVYRASQPNRFTTTAHGQALIYSLAPDA